MAAPDENQGCYADLSQLDPTMLQAMSEACEWPAQWPADWQQTGEWHYPMYDYSGEYAAEYSAEPFEPFPDFAASNLATSSALKALSSDYAAGDLVTSPVLKASSFPEFAASDLAMVEPAPGLWLPSDLPPGLGGCFDQEDSDVECEGDFQRRVSHEGEHEPNSEPEPFAAQRCPSTASTGDPDEDIFSLAKGNRMPASLRRKLLLLPLPEQQPLAEPAEQCPAEAKPRKPLSELPVRYQRRPVVRAAENTALASLCIDVPLVKCR